MERTSNRCLQRYGDHRRNLVWLRASRDAFTSNSSSVPSASPSPGQKTDYKDDLQTSNQYANDQNEHSEALRLLDSFGSPTAPGPVPWRVRWKTTGPAVSAVSHNQLCKIHDISGEVPLDATPVPACVLLDQAGHSDDELASCVLQGHTVGAVRGKGDNVARVPEIASAPVLGVVLVVGIIVTASRNCVQLNTCLHLFIHDHGV